MSNPTASSRGGLSGLVLGLVLLLLPTRTAGHGHMLSPRSRNWYAYEVGRDDVASAPPGVPPREYCSHCLNAKLASETCGRGSAQPYDASTGWKDAATGAAIPWNAQETYVEGQEILVTSELTTNHAGHMELRACPLGEGATDATQECFDAHPLEFVRDVCFDGPADEIYPVRGYYSNNVVHHFVYKLPPGLVGSRVLLQWRYIAANSCLPPGYTDEERLGLDARGWLRGFSLAKCNVDESEPPQLVLDPTGGRGAGDPEQFWNCAEVSILTSEGTNDPEPHPAGTDICTGTVPAPPPPTGDPPPTSPTPPSPTSPSNPPPPTPPTASEGYCNWGPLGTGLSSTCDGCVQGGDVCNAGAHACETDCGGRWCTNLDAVPACGDGGSNPPPPPAPTPPSPPANANFCGMSWADAQNATCGAEVGNANTPCADGNSTVCGHGRHCYAGIVCPGTEPPPPPPSPTPPSPTPPTGGTSATTTRYWDCSGGACGCAYLPLGPGTDATPSHCHSNAMFAAPAGNEHGAAFYGAAAVSRFLWDGNTNSGDWMGEGCGKCWKVTGSSNVGSNVGLSTTVVLKGTNICPTGICNENGKAHFDVAAPGFDVLEYSWSNSCETVEPDELEGFQSCGRWMIDSQDPEVNCDCSKFASPVLKAGCENFYSLMWDNAPVEYEEVTCPPEVERLPCWEDNGNGYPQTGVPELCMDPHGDPSVVLPFPGAPPTDPPPPPSPTPPSPPPPSPPPPSPTPPTGGEYEPITCPDGYENARWTWYISYPKCCEDQPHYDPSASRTECDVYNGCAWDGDFAYVGHRPYSYVQDTNIVAFFASNGETYAKKIISVFSPVHDKTVEAIVLDTCGDLDCNGCCTVNANAGGGYLVDMEEETVLKHFGSLGEVDGRVCWKILPDEEYDAGGYCNWSGCNGDPQGGWDCNLNEYECNSACSGTWCPASDTTTTATQPATTTQATTTTQAATTTSTKAATTTTTTQAATTTTTTQAATTTTTTQAATTSTTTTTQAATTSTTTTTQAATTTTKSAGGDPCCTWDFKICSDSNWCNESESNCKGSCGGPFWADVDCPVDGIGKGDDCTNNPTSCCPGLTCFEHSQWYRSCELPAQ